MLGFFSLCPPAGVFHDHNPRTLLSHTDANDKGIYSIRKNLPVSMGQPRLSLTTRGGRRALQRWGVEMSVGASRCLGAPGQSGEAAPLSFLRAWVQLTELLNSTPNIAQSANDLLLEP